MYASKLEKWTRKMARRMRHEPPSPRTWFNIQVSSPHFHTHTKADASRYPTVPRHNLKKKCKRAVRMVRSKMCNITNVTANVW